MIGRNQLSQMRITLILIALLFGLGSCSVQKQIAKSAKAAVLDNKALQAAHVGISIYDPTSKQYLYNYQGDKYFVPASNTKIPTCYAAMKYLGDSLVAARYHKVGNVLYIKAAGDPTFLHPEFSDQPLLTLLKESGQEIKIEIPATVEPLGNGWSWNDYDQNYMAERSGFPLFGNMIWLSDKRLNEKQRSNADSLIRFISGGPEYWVTPKYMVEKLYGDVEMNGRQRDKDRNQFYIKKFTGIKTIPFVTYHEITKKVLSGVLDKKIGDGYYSEKDFSSTIIHSQPTDSLLKPMMHRSDNFFAEQSLLMVSNEKLGLMSDEKIIDTLLKTDLKDLPQKPRWADGSGLSRYNLFTPQDFVTILNKMKNEFGMDRLKVIFPTGGEGTISSYYRNMSGSIFGKTGTLSGVVAFSGYLYTKKGRLLIFSTLVNNHQASATDVRRAVEQFLTGIRERY